MSRKTASTFMQGQFVFFRVIAIIFVALREKIVAAVERRRIHRALSQLDDYMLKDMGIARADIERIASRTYPPREATRGGGPLAI